MEQHGILKHLDIDRIKADILAHHRNIPVNGSINSVAPLVVWFWVG
jgi:hypothetical protein